MLFFPFTDHLFSVGAWAYAGQTGRYTDAGAYFSGLGFVWDGVWSCGRSQLARHHARVLHRDHLAADPFWRWAGRYVPRACSRPLPRVVLLRHRRWVAWLIWAHVVRSFPFDLRWGGPRWVPRVFAEDLNAAPVPGRPAIYAFVGAIAWARRFRQRE